MISIGDGCKLYFWGEELGSVTESRWISGVVEQPIVKPKRPYIGGTVRVVNRLGRNQPCTCGSGRKFKVCCMRKASP